ncbi:hypothetical protein PVAP13_2NG068992 [Panicum virgatum]|uniref:Uncharacterized protein n=1 Tax=Panicum virgatum TaxID=38727 RepID=A0A8T0VCY0_PANVG|nr:hypothetical protein PVAP13_2NG068992 [Panicum virgatum]
MAVVTRPRTPFTATAVTPSEPPPSSCWLLALGLTWALMALRMASTSELWDTSLVWSSWPRRADGAEEGLHGGELVVDVLEVAVDAPDQGVLLGEEAAQLAQEGPHGRLRGAHHELHCRRPLPSYLCCCCCW